MDLSGFKYLDVGLQYTKHHLYSSDSTHLNHKKLARWMIRPITVESETAPITT